MGRGRTALLCASLTLAMPALASGEQNEPAPDSADQSRGAVLYAQRCAACHGEDLRHGEGAPELIGPTFLQRWNARPAREQIDRLQATMPQDDPGTLTRDEAAALRTFILAQNCQSTSS